MTRDQEIKQEMRLYEIYSTAALTGCIIESAFTDFDDLANRVDEITQEMIKKHTEYLEILERHYEQ
jgi:hypothetical protein